MSSSYKIINSLRNNLKWVGVILFYILFVALWIESPINVFARSIDPDSNTENISPDNTGWFCYLPLISQSGCAPNTFGTMLLGDDSTILKSPADVMIYANDQVGIKGMVSAGAPSDYVRDEWFGKLPGWTRSILRGTYDQLITIHTTAITFSMEDMYECIGYGPESVHQAGPEALEPMIWVPKAKQIADSTGKCLIYGPAVLDYEYMSTKIGETKYDDEELGDLVSSVSPYVDIWMIQLAKYQRWTDAGRDDFGNSFYMTDFYEWVKWWVTQIEKGNPEAKVWAQLGIGIFDPINDQCLEPQPPEYILNYRETLLRAGVDGVFVVPSQPCQMSTNPEDQENYLKSLDVLQQAIEQACN